MPKTPLPAVTESIIYSRPYNNKFLLEPRQTACLTGPVCRYHLAPKAETPPRTGSQREWESNQLTKGSVQLTRQNIGVGLSAGVGANLSQLVEQALLASIRLLCLLFPSLGNQQFERAGTRAFLRQMLLRARNGLSLHTDLLRQLVHSAVKAFNKRPQVHQASETQCGTWRAGLHSILLSETRQLLMLVFQTQQLLSLVLQTLRRVLRLVLCALEQFSPNTLLHCSITLGRRRGPPPVGHQGDRPARWRSSCPQTTQRRSCLVASTPSAQVAARWPGQPSGPNPIGRRQQK